MVAKLNTAPCTPQYYKKRSCSRKLCKGLQLLYVRNRPSRPTTVRVLLLAHTLPKRTDKLSAKEKNIAKQTVLDYLRASRSETGIQWVE